MTPGGDWTNDISFAPMGGGILPYHWRPSLAHCETGAAKGDAPGKKSPAFLVWANHGQKRRISHLWFSNPCSLRARLFKGNSTLSRPANPVLLVDHQARLVAAWDILRGAPPGLEFSRHHVWAPISDQALCRRRGNCDACLT